MMGGDNIAEQCRLCGNSGEESLNLFDKTISKIDLVNVINETLHLTVRETDSLPKKICVTCKKIIEEFERFRQSCILAEKSFLLMNEDNTDLLEPECSLKEEENSLVSKEEKLSTLEIDVEPDLNLDLENIKVEVDEEHQPDCSDDTHFSGDDLDYDEAVIKEPHKDDYILVKQDRFTLDESARRLQNSYVEFCKPGITPTDRLLVENVKKRQALPEMWDVYEMESQHNMTKVTMRRYIISKEAFPCSLCNKCISVKSESQEEDNWDSSVEYQGHTEGVIDEVFDKGNLTDSQSHKVGKKCSIAPSCEICKKSFNRAQSLKRHYRTHYGYERLPCEVCGKGFSRKEHLARHMILHTGGRPFECICCKKRFTRKEHLTRHIQLHEGRDCSERPIGYLEEYGGIGYEKPPKRKRKSYECRPKPYSCDICCAGFGQKEHLMKHLRRMHHNQEYDGCSEATKPTVNQNEEKVSSSTSCEGKMNSDPLPVSVPAQSSPPASPASTSLPAALALTPVSAQPVQTPTPVSSPPAPSPASTLPPDMPTRTEKNLFLCALCPRSFSRSEQLGRHLKVHRRDSMFVNESRVPGTDITFSFTNSND